MPKNEKVYKSMKKQYGKDKAEDIYYGWEENQKKKGKTKRKKQ